VLTTRLFSRQTRYETLVVDPVDLPVVHGSGIALLRGGRRRDSVDSGLWAQR